MGFGRSARRLASSRQYIIVWRRSVYSWMAEPDDKPIADKMADSPRCKHVRKRLIAKDEDAEYWECLDCGEIFEPGEGGDNVVNLDGSLSDA
jgi:ribosomal protein L37AE/L43A